MKKQNQNVKQVSTKILQQMLGCAEGKRKAQILGELENRKVVVKF
jgi:fructose-specific component phosphotransferase system IIB-like protein